MKFTTVIVLVVVMCVVVMEAKLTKEEKQAKRQARRQNKKNNKEACQKQITFSTCDATTNKMNRTITTCKKNGQSKTFERNCTEIKKYTVHSTCEITRTLDFTACADANENLRNATVTVTVSADCAQHGISGMSESLRCDTNKLDKALRMSTKAVLKGVKNGGGKGAGRKNNKERKQNRKDRRANRGNKQMAGEKCKYKRQTWSDCDPETNMKTMMRRLKPGSSSTCESFIVVERPCSRPKNKPNKQITGCKYRRGEWSECDGTTNIKTMVKTLKRGDPNTCEQTQTIEKICKRQHKGLRTNCKYRKTEKWGPCDPTTGLKSRQGVLKKGDPKVCAPKQIMTKQCKKKKKKKEKTVKVKKGCKYEKSQWGPCDASTNTVRRTLNLKSGDTTKCNATKLQVKKCKNRHLRPHICKYKRTTWEECDPVTNMRVMIKTLKRGDPSKCEPTETVERKCKGKKKMNVCKYKYEPWSACNVTTNTMTRRQVLTNGPESCQAVKEYSKKCKKPCKWENGIWSECDTETNQMTRVDTLRTATDPSCPKTRVLSKKCGKEKKCMYDHGTWSECDSTSDTPERVRTQKLISGGPGCQPEKTTTKSCTKPNGEVRCFFGPWQEYDECRNGVQKKRRQVIQGGLDCERKSVKMKAC